MATSESIEPFVLAEPEPAGGRRWHALSPILIGLMAPFVVFIVLNPGARGMLFLSVIILAVILIVAFTVFVMTVTNPGVIQAFAFDRAARRVDLIHEGTFGNTSTRVPFAEVRSVGFVTRYDDDGYKSVVPVMTLTTGEQIDLPETTTEEDVRTVRRLVGL
jgi:hypothetical protein